MRCRLILPLPIAAPGMQVFTPLSPTTGSWVERLDNLERMGSALHPAMAVAPRGRALLQVGLVATRPDSAAPIGIALAGPVHGVQGHAYSAQFLPRQPP